MAQRYQGGILGVGFNPLQAPNAPTIGAATAGNQTVSVAFTAPANVGGSAISTYAVRVSPGNFSATGSASPISVSGLTNDVAYTFSVAALNSYGPSPYSGTVTATPLEPLYVENVFSTWLYTGNGGTQTITNGVNLAGKGGLVWIKQRTNGNHSLFDTVRGGEYWLGTHTTIPQQLNTLADGRITSFNSDGFTLGTAGGNQTPNGLNFTQVAWTFREAPNFFDIVSYVGDGTTGRVISHNLGSAPGMIVIKAVSATSNWFVYHRSTADMGLLNATDSFNYSSRITSVTSSSFTVTSSNAGVGATNVNGVTYVAYLYGHNTASDGIIQCGSYTGNGSASGPTVTLGWEPQWLLFKRANSASGWYIIDNMRGMALTGNGNSLYPNLTDGENGFWAANFATINPTGFQIVNTDSDINSSGSTYLYMAIRRGPMKTPTVGTTVFAPQATRAASDGTALQNSFTANFPVDLCIQGFRDGGGGTAAQFTIDRLRGSSPWLATSSTGVENANTTYSFASNTGIYPTTTLGAANLNGWMFRRAPSFFDEVCYTGTGVARTVNHNLGVAPELMIVKGRSSGNEGNWNVYSQTLGNTGIILLNMSLGANDFGTSNIWWNSTSPTATQFTVGTRIDSNGSGYNYVAYLFASCPGVSKVGSYTGNGSSQTINCGFTTGARFFLVKAASTTGNWWVWDSARGITAPADPALALNSTAAEVTSADATDPDNSGIIVNQEATCSINANGVTYIFLAIS